MFYFCSFSTECDWENISCEILVGLLFKFQVDTISMEKLKRRKQLKWTCCFQEMLNLKSGEKLEHILIDNASDIWHTSLVIIFNFTFSLSWFPPIFWWVGKTFVSSAAFLTMSSFKKRANYLNMTFFPRNSLHSVDVQAKMLHL